MQALLGKITQIARPEGEDVPGDHYKISFKPACVLPDRAKVPEWLGDQTLTFERAVRDPREIGYPGDSLVLTTQESRDWLAPLAVTPNVAVGELPITLRLDLRWWKDDKPPEFTVHANGRRVTGQFTKEDAGWGATVETSALFDRPPLLPVTLEVTCDKLKAACTVAPADAPGAEAVLLPDGEVQRMRGPWYAVDVLARSHGGGILALRETGRGRDHFAAPPDVIQPLFEYAGQQDRYRQNWGPGDQIKDAKMTSAGARREGQATRLSLEGQVDEGQNLRSTVAYTLYDAFPLLHVRREFQFGEQKKDDKKDEKPKEPIDDLRPMGVGFRAAWAAERDGSAGSRILCVEGGRLAVMRGAEPGDRAWNEHWRPQGGWVLAEHPARRECMLYLFDPDDAPYLPTRSTVYSLTLEPFWDMVPVRPGGAAGFAAALSAGELCGAGVDGAWVACRVTTAGGVRCALLGRLPEAAAVAQFTLGGERREVSVRQALLPGIGTVSYATADFVAGDLASAFDAEAAGILSRRSG